MFCNFAKNSKIQNGPHFLQENFFFENLHDYSAEIPCGSKISSKSIYLVRFSRYRYFYVLQFLRKIRKFKMAAIFGETKFFQNWDIYSAEIPYGSKISSKSLYLARFSRYKHFCVLQFLRKIQKGRHFWRDKIFLKIGITTLQRYPVAQKFRRNRSI